MEPEAERRKKEMSRSYYVNVYQTRNHNWFSAFVAAQAMENSKEQ
jgi:hypothetical protein